MSTRDKPVFYRQTILVEMLYRDDYPARVTFDQMARIAFSSDVSGEIKSVETEVVSSKEMVDLLKEQGTEPEWLGLNDFGEDIYEEEE